MKHSRPGRRGLFQDGSAPIYRTQGGPSLQYSSRRFYNRRIKAIRTRRLTNTPTRVMFSFNLSPVCTCMRKKNNSVHARSSITAWHFWWSAVVFINSLNPSNTGIETAGYLCEFIRTFHARLGEKARTYLSRQSGANWLPGCSSVRTSTSCRTWYPSIPLRKWTC